MTTGIPTVYKGTRFRSRLEARWACFFDNIGWRWEYEPFDLGGYIPDFIVFGTLPLLVEVKPLQNMRDLEVVLDSLILKPNAWGEDGDLLVVGVTPLLHTDQFFGLAAGYMTERGWEMCPSEGLWARCFKCGAMGVFNFNGSWGLRPCGHQDGDSLLDEPVGLQEAWAAARNATQWKPPK